MADRPRHLPVPRGHASRGFTSVSAPICSNATAQWHVVRRLGAECRQRRGDRRLQRLGRTSAHPLQPRGDGSGIWEGIRRRRRAGQPLQVPHRLAATAATASTRPIRSPSRRTAAAHRRRGSGTLDYEWSDDDWMKNRGARNALDAPMSIYEVHLGSWRATRRRPGRFLGYREIARALADYVRDDGLHARRADAGHGASVLRLVGLPDAPATSRRPSRYGTPQDFMSLVDLLHQRGHRRDPRLGAVALSRRTSTGSRYFDGTHLYEHADPRQGFHPEWSSCDLQLRPQRGARLPRSRARLFWLEQLPRRRAARGCGRLDALPRLRAQARRVDPEPRTAGARTSRRSSSCAASTSGVYRDYPDVQTIAEESTAWPMVSRPTYVGGLGFGMKWNMGWMHDTLDYFQRGSDPPQATTTTSSPSACGTRSHENFVLPLSHDEVVHGKGSLIGKMPGDDWQQFANLRAAVRLHVGASRQEAAVHGRRVRPAARVDARRRASTGTCSAMTAPRAACSAGSRDLNRALPRRARAARDRFRRRPASSGSMRSDAEQQRDLRSCAGEHGGDAAIAGGRATSRRCRATTTASACRAAAAGASS